MDKQYIARGVSRTSIKNFGLWILPWFILLLIGVYAVFLCLTKGLNQTNMDNRFAFGLWIYLDLTVIALGAGAFFTGFLLYILKKKELKAVINSAVVIGFICYSGAVGGLMVDVGQPLRAWFTFWYPNVHSMLTEVTFCITCYLMVLAIEYVPVILKNRKIKQFSSMLVFEHELHKLIVVFAGVGTFLSFFHQGSLGGLYGVLHRTSVCIPAGTGHLAHDIFPFYNFCSSSWAELYSAHHSACFKAFSQAACHTGSISNAGKNIRQYLNHLRPLENCRYAGMDQ